MTQPTDPDSHPIKLHLFGDGGEGKTCFLIRASQNTFPQEYIPTVFDNYNMDVMHGQKKISLGLWDYSSRDGEDRWLKVSLPGTDVILLCYAVNRTTDLQYMKKRWLPQFEQYAPGVPILLVGFKEDLRTEPKFADRIVTPERAQQLAKELGALDHMTCSSKTGEGVKEVIDRAVALALKYTVAGKPAPKAGAKNRCIIC